MLGQITPITTDTTALLTGAIIVENESRGEKIKQSCFDALKKQFKEITCNANDDILNGCLREVNLFLLGKSYMKQWVVQQSGKATRREKQESERCLMEIATVMNEIVKKIAAAYQIDGIGHAILQLSVVRGIVTAQFYRKHKSKDSALVKSIFNGITLRSFLTPFAHFIEILRAQFSEFNWKEDFDVHLDISDCREWKLPIMNIASYCSTSMQSARLRQQNATLRDQNTRLQSDVAYYHEKAIRLEEENLRLKGELRMQTRQSSQSNYDLMRQSHHITFNNVTNQPRQMKNISASQQIYQQCHRNLDTTNSNGFMIDQSLNQSSLLNADHYNTAAATLINQNQNHQNHHTQNHLNLNSNLNNLNSNRSNVNVNMIRNQNEFNVVNNNNNHNIGNINNCVNNVNNDNINGNNHPFLTDNSSNSSTPSSVQFEMYNNNNMQPFTTGCVPFGHETIGSIHPSIDDSSVPNAPFVTERVVTHFGTDDFVPSISACDVTQEFRHF